MSPGGVIVSATGTSGFDQAGGATDRTGMTTAENDGTGVQSGTTDVFTGQSPGKVTLPSDGLAV